MYLGWVGGVACTWFSWGNLRERDQWGDSVVDMRTILSWNFRKWDMELWTGLVWVRIDMDGGHL
jgi:hypothetical protein